MKKLAILAALLLLSSTLVFAQEETTTPEVNVNQTTTNAMDLSDKTKTGLSLYGSTGTTASNTSPLIGKTSTGVGLGIAAGPVGYALTTQHISGTKVFGSRHDSTSIFTTDVTTVGVAVLAQPAIDQDFETAGWKPL